MEAPNALRVSTFGSPTVFRSTRAPATPDPFDVELSRRSVLPEKSAAAAAFAATARDEAVGPFGERPGGGSPSGDALDLDPTAARECLDARPSGAAFARAPRGSPERTRGGDALDLNPDQGRGVAETKKNVYVAMDHRPGRDDASEKFDEGDWLALSPGASRRSLDVRRASAVFGDAARWDESAPEFEALALSPKLVRTHTRGFDLSRHSDRWRQTSDDERWSKADLQEARARARADAADAGPVVESARRSASGAFYPRAASVEFSKSDRFEKVRSSGGDALDLEPRDATLSTVPRAPEPAFRTSARFDDGPSNDDGDRLRLEPRDPSHARRENAVTWGAPPPTPTARPDGDALDLDPRRPSAGPRGHVAMKTVPGREDLARPTGDGDVLRLEATDAPVARRKDRAVAFASLPNEPKLRKPRPRRQRAKPSRVDRLQRRTDDLLADAADAIRDLRVL